MTWRAVALLAIVAPLAVTSPPLGAERVAPDPLALDGASVQGGLVTGRLPPGSTLTLGGRPLAVAPDGAFILGFDRDAGPNAMLVATLPDGRTLTRPLAVAPRAWRMSRLPTLARIPVPDADFARVRPGELARITAARGLVTDAAGWRQRFRWPVTGRISTLFGSQRVYADGAAGAYHSGIDIARSAGTIVRAPADGVVVLAADHPFTLEGNLLMIDHGLALSSSFLHLSRIDVHVGDHVRQGEPIGLVGMTGRATGPHLHWGLHWQDARLDPLLVAGAMPPA